MKESLSDLRVPKQRLGVAMRAALETPFFPERVETLQFPVQQRGSFVACSYEHERVERGEVHSLTLVATPGERLTSFGVAARVALRVSAGMRDARYDRFVTDAGHASHAAGYHDAVSCDPVFGSGISFAMIRG